MRLTEKYRPKNWDELVGQDEIIKSIREALKNPIGIPHFLFVGPAGVGKTTTAYLIARELKVPIIEFNASDERGIDTIRTKIKQLASIRGKRIILLDEADNMTADAQQALRRIMERTMGTIFILVGNTEYKIIDPIKSRCAIYRFKKLSDKDVLKKLIEVCKAEGIKITKDQKEGFLAIVKEANGDLRKALNILQSLLNENKEINAKNVLELREISMPKDALNFALRGDFEKARELIEDAFINSKYSPDKVIEGLYKAIGELNDREIKIRLYTKLSDVEYRCRIGSSPLIQLVGFIAWAWVLPHLRGCPALRGETE